MLRRIITLLLAAILIAYPLLVYGGLLLLKTRILALLLMALAIVRFALMRPARSAAGERHRGFGGRQFAVASLACAIVIFFVAAASNNAQAFRFYPVFMNAMFLLLFLASWFNPPTVIERLARIKEPDLPETGVRYTGHVTLVWCAFFVFNGSIALITSIWTSFDVWALYNGLISYLLMAALFVAEYLVRINVRKREGSL